MNRDMPSLPAFAKLCCRPLGRALSRKKNKTNEGTFSRDCTKYSNTFDMFTGSVVSSADCKFVLHQHRALYVPPIDWIM